MTESKENKKFEKVIQKIVPQSKLLRTWEMKGGVSAQVTALEIEQNGDQTKKMIVRRHGAVDLKRNPHLAADESRLLQLLHRQHRPRPNRLTSTIPAQVSPL